MITAVVGGGLGGATAAYRLKKMFGDQLPQIDVYEMDQVGGRLKVIDIEGKRYEVGGTIIHPDNQHMKDFVAELGTTNMLYIIIPCTYLFLFISL